MKKLKLPKATGFEEYLCKKLAFTTRQPNGIFVEQIKVQVNNNLGSGDYLYLVNGEKVPISRINTLNGIYFTDEDYAWMTAKYDIDKHLIDLENGQVI